MSERERGDGRGRGDRDDWEERRAREVDRRVQWGASSGDPYEDEREPAREARGRRGDGLRGGAERSGERPGWRQGPGHHGWRDEPAGGRDWAPRGGGGFEPRGGGWEPRRFDPAPEREGPDRAAGRRRHAGIGYAGEEPGDEDYGWREPGPGSSSGVGYAGYGSPPPRARGARPSGPFAGRGPKGWRRSDERILEDASEALARHPDVDASEIEVSCEQGELVLRGTVPDRSTKRLAESCVEDVGGVHDVRNELRVARAGASPAREPGAPGLPRPPGA